MMRQSGIEKTPHREHVLRALFSVEMHHVAMKVDITGKWRRNHPERAHAPDQRIRKQRAVLNAEAGILSGRFLLDLFVNSENTVDCQVAIGMRCGSMKPKSR